MAMAMKTGSCVSLRALATTAVLFLSLGTSSSTIETIAEDKIPLTISYQPATYWALPIYIAEQKGYFDELGLNVSYVVVSCVLA